jgi:hypothetical protein
MSNLLNAACIFIRSASVSARFGAGGFSSLSGAT